MGVNITELLVRKELDIKELHGKVLAVDAHLFLYQFLTSIRQRDGSYLMDSKGNITSHLSGLFFRNAKLMQEGIKLAYVFDGKPPALKEKEIQRRRALKQEAELRYEEAKKAEDLEQMRKYASRTTKLTKEMIAEAKKLLVAMGIPVIEAPSEGEAQASYMVKQEKAFAVASQDADSLLFGSPRLVRNLSLAGKRKKSSVLAYEEIRPELVHLSETLNALGLAHDQLIALGMLVGTDFNDAGIKGIGQKKGLALVKKYGENFDALFEEVKWKESFAYPWQEVFDIFTHMPVNNEYALKWNAVDSAKIRELLVEEHDFSEERVNAVLEKIEEEKTVQKGLGEFL